VLCQPLPVLLDMDVDELMLWHAQAVRVEKIRSGEPR
jgi:hypothetical protein